MLYGTPSARDALSLPSIATACRCHPSTTRPAAPPGRPPGPLRLPPRQLARTVLHTPAPPPPPHPRSAKAMPETIALSSSSTPPPPPLPRRLHPSPSASRCEPKQRAVPPPHHGVRAAHRTATGAVARPGVPRAAGAAAAERGEHLRHTGGAGAAGADGAGAARQPGAGPDVDPRGSSGGPKGRAPCVVPRDLPRAPSPVGRCLESWGSQRNVAGSPWRK